MLQGTLPEALTFVQLPTVEEISEFGKPELWNVQDGKVISEDLGENIRIFIAHETRKVPFQVEGEESSEVERTFAYPIVVAKQEVYSSLVDAAEKQEYNESEINCVNRRGRKDTEDPVVKLHDDFIEWVMQELHKIGY